MSRRASGLAVMAAPALAMLFGVFLGPIGLFLAQTLARPGADASGVWATLRSGATLGALRDTTTIAALVTLSTLLLGYPLAYALTRLRGAAFALLIAAVTLPHFTSVIVRTYAWMVVLGRHGVINETLAAAHAGPLSLLYNRTGVLIGMTYVLLPYMVLTLYAAMRTVDPALLRAARSLGAGTAATFLRVFLPLTAPGVAAGGLTVFVQGLGFFVTPSLMGGPRDTTVSMMIGHIVESDPDWTAAATLSLTLLAPTLMLYALYCRLADPRRLLG